MPPGVMGKRALCQCDKISLPIGNTRPKREACSTAENLTAGQRPGRRPWTEQQSQVRFVRDVSYTCLLASVVYFRQKGRVNKKRAHRCSNSWCAQTVGIFQGDTPCGPSTSVSHIACLSYHIRRARVKWGDRFFYKIRTVRPSTFRRSWQNRDTAWGRSFHSHCSMTRR